MYLIHWPLNGLSSPKVPMHVLWPKMEQLKEMGLTRAIGVSNFNTQLLADMLTYCQTKPAVNQIQLHPRCAQQDLLRFLFDHEIIPIAYSPVGRPDDQNGADDILTDPLVL